MDHKIKSVGLGIPDYISVETEGKSWTGNGVQNVFCIDDIRLEIKDENGSEAVFLTADTSEVRRVVLRWKKKFPRKVKVLGDAWERSYGELEWRGICGSRIMPWYFLLSSEDMNWGYGVKVRPSAMCFWQMDSQGITLVLDARCGGRGVSLGGRTLKAAEIVAMEAEKMESFEAAKEFCRMMCTDPVLPDSPVYGSNNWYYAFGESSEEEILRDTDYLLKLTKEAEHMPYMVIDDSWQELRTPEYIGGPWKKGNDKFPDMKGLAEKIKEKGVHPGIWIRFLQNKDGEIREEWRMKHNGCLDPSRSEVQEYIRRDVKRICEWGYELIKHDFSTYDLFGRWGFEMNPLVTTDGWSFFDRTKTSAEIVKEFYEIIYQEAGKYKALILGCNTIGHLGAGLMHINRTGDDVSGIYWERVRRMGINTLAFRLPQHRTFYEVDADCIGVVGKIPWELNRQWADVLAESGTPLFVSAMPGILDEKQEEELRQIMYKAAGQQNHKVPVDWQETNCPEIWSDEKETCTYQWYEEEGSVTANKNEKYLGQIPLS